MLQYHTPQHTLCTPNGSLRHAVVAVSLWAHAPPSLAPLSGLTASEPAGSFPTKMKKCSLVHSSRCPDSLPLVPSPIFLHVSCSNCLIFIPDTEVEFHDDREACTIDDTLVVDLLQLDCVEESVLRSSSNMNASWCLLISLADASGFVHFCSVTLDIVLVAKLVHRLKLGPTKVGNVLTICYEHVEASLPFHAHSRDIPDGIGCQCRGSATSRNCGHV